MRRSIGYGYALALAAVPVLFHLVIAAPALAAERTGGAPGKIARERPGTFKPGTFDTETRHSLTVDGIRIDYTARTGMLTVPPGDTRGEKGRMFFISYSRAEPGGPRRPLTFVFNGGPGAAAAYLNVGVMGPRRLAFSDDGRVADSPKIVDNAESWLRFTDLVFVDPVGTGFSRAIRPAAKNGGSQAGGGRRRERSQFWATDGDLDSIGAFIRLYLTRNDRWLGPTVLAGESYGGFRVAALADRLQSRYGISISGLVMISPALEPDLLSTDRFRLMSWVSRVPSFAAVARYHGRTKAGGAADDPEPLRAVERFAIEKFLPGLARGGALDEADRTALLSRVADYIGLPHDVVIRYGGKVPSEVFAARLLRSDGRIVSLYDGSISYPAPHPAASRYRDPRLARISAAVAAAFNHVVRTGLGVKTDLPYQVLNRRVSAQWKWQEGRGPEGSRNAAESLERSLKTVPDLHALLVHGIYDLVTPYLTSAFVVNQLDLTPELRRRITLRNYEGGHMFYSHAASRKALYADARHFYGEIAADAR